jgi:hypothetical protein
MALAGQVVEVFAVLRLVLEYAGYCALTNENPALQGVFVLRHAGEGEVAAQRKEFKIGAVRQTLERLAPALLKTYDVLYQRTIDFGGHPNPHAIFSGMDWHIADGQIELASRI